MKTMYEIRYITTNREYRITRIAIDSLDNFMELNPGIKLLAIKEITKVG